MPADNPQPADLLADLPPLDPPASPAPVASAESDAATSTAVLSSPLAAAATAASVKPAARATEPDAKDGAKAPAAAPVVKPVPAQDRNESAAKSRPAKEPEGPAPAGADAEKPRFSLPAIASEPDLPPAAQAPPPAAARVGIDSSPGFGLAPLSAATTAAAQGATSPAAMPAVAVPLAGLAIEIAARARAGVNRFEIRLDPPELGRIDVRLEVARDGKATSHVTVDRPETLSLLQREQPQLERALEQAGLKTADNGLQFTLRDQSFAGRDGTGRQQTARLVVPDAALSPLDPAPTYSRLLGPGGLDIRV
jgi:chemotaxis protein MotD